MDARGRLWCPSRSDAEWYAAIQYGDNAGHGGFTFLFGYSLSWSGQYEYLARAKARLEMVAPFTLAIIIFLLYLNFRRITEVVIILATLPLALVGGAWLLYLLGYHLSVAVGFIALSGVAVEIGVVMLVYLNQAFKKDQQRAEEKGCPLAKEDIANAIIAFGS